MGIRGKCVHREEERRHPIERDLLSGGNPPYFRKHLRKMPFIEGQAGAGKIQPLRLIGRQFCEQADPRLPGLRPILKSCFIMTALPVGMYHLHTLPNRILGIDVNPLHWKIAE